MVKAGGYYVAGAGSVSDAGGALVSGAAVVKAMTPIPSSAAKSIASRVPDSLFISRSFLRRGEKSRPVCTAYRAVVSYFRRSCIIFASFLQFFQPTSVYSRSTSSEAASE